ncbi:TPA: hypothetical protein EYP37_10580 [Candidatus Poribacteria bacterium]|nr:hypothetical protein [Candidatus Poribacteria bacterium]
MRFWVLIYLLALAAISLSGCLAAKEFVMTPAPTRNATILPLSGGIGIEKKGVIAVALPINNIKEMDVFALILVNKREHWISFYKRDCILLDQKGNEVKPFKDKEAKANLSRGVKPFIPLPFRSEVLRWRKDVITAPGTTLLPVENPEKLSILPGHKLRVFLYFKKQSVTSSQLILIVPKVFDEVTGEKISFAFRFKVEKR